MFRYYFYNFLKGFFAGICLVMIACSKGPRQYKHETAPDVKGALESVPTRTKIDPLVRNGEKSDTLEAKAIANSQKPIIYKEGAAGITFETAYEDAAQILTFPKYGMDSDNDTFYDSGIKITWTSHFPRVPEVMVILKSYLGYFQLNEPLKPMRMKDRFTKFQQSDANLPLKEKGLSLARALYEAVESRNEKEEDCIKERKCYVSGWDTEEQDYFSITLPQMSISIAKETYAIVLIILVKNEEKADLKRPIDLIHGSLVERGDLNKEVLKIGQSFNQVKGLVGGKLKEKWKPRAIQLDWQQVTLMFQKSDNVQKKASGNEELQSIVAGYDLNEPVILNGQYVIIDRESALKLSVSSSIPVGEKEILQSTTQVKGEDQKEFLQKLGALISGQFREVFPHEEQISFIYHNPLSEEEINASVILSYDKKESAGRIVKIFMGKNYEIFYEMNVSKISSDNLFSKSLGDYLKSEISLKEKTEIQERFLGKEVIVDHILKAEKEGQVYLSQDPSQKKYGELIQAQTEQYVDGSKKMKLRKVLKMQFDLFEMGIEVLETHSNQIRGRIVSITSYISHQVIKDVCDGVDITYTDSANQIFKKANQCSFFMEKEGDHSEKIKAIYFPERGLKFQFRRSQISAVTFYEGGAQ